MKKYILLFLLVLMFSCVEDIHHNAIDTTIVNPDMSQKTEITFKQLYNLHNNEIGKDTIVTGYVVSSDQQGNFYKEIFVQNTLGVSDLGLDNPRMGMRIRVGLTTTSTKYAKGRKVVINLEGLKRTTSDDLLTLGKPSGTYIKDILEFELDDYILKTDEVGIVIPKTLELSDLKTNDLNTLVKIQEVHFKENQIGLPFSGLPTDNYDGIRTLEFCNSKRRDTILLETSNFADFSDNMIPNAQVDITAIYNISFDNEPILVLNQIEDLIEIGAYANCVEIVTPNLMITEVADPKAGTGEVVRYVELYNPTENTVSLEGWSLVRYNKTSTNDNLYSISLDGLSIAAHATLIIANNDEDIVTNKTWFEAYFGFAPAMINSNVNGNGDDAYELVDPLNEVKDVYGVPNVDGTGLTWEYEDGVAVRKINISKPKALFDEVEWIIKKDATQLNTSGGNIDFTPGIR
ncbi:DUF5689 domain-containing protein [Wenyingzhuangia sp. chi5]|uniref:DUF5689 domain-containing protein n=1 Tax=Wenyingzhuangia gilva TaxID=3057677 RepID=A0ABT8VP07_9FLAO|nr:DUF5689 domain-containing protein [Wenyingzhuangia sp. chi5]MDO3693692.1 DUF5689 domain-containing protein [Wenyingzhuangia sp. chi5]